MMSTFQVTAPETMRTIFQTFSCLDGIRWSMSANYNLINHYRNDLTADEKLLTHWLCYILDRQMPFLRIWEVGGYVVSHLVWAFTRRKQGDVRQLLISYMRQDDGKIRLECPREGDNARLASYDIDGDTVSFSSRYLPDDLVRIYRTLIVLDRTSQRSFSRFVGEVLREGDDHRQGIRKMAAALNSLTYDAGGSFNAANFAASLDKMDQDVASFVVKASTRRKLFDRKRLWCSIRDYLKSPEFNVYFLEGLGAVNSDQAARWSRDNAELKVALDAIELPGDVWNNAQVFRKGLFSPYLHNERKSWDMPRTVRRIYDLLSADDDLAFYPEQLDVTFDFVPRMCEVKMCDVCLFGGGVKELCHQKPDLLCPVVLVACGYKHKCNPDACDLMTNSAKGLCQSSMIGHRDNQTITPFTAKKIAQLRRRAGKAAQLPDDVPSGWSKSPIDPMAVLAVFKALKTKEGYILRAYQFREGGNGNGFVSAMPIDAKFPRPEECHRLEGVFLEPPKPPAALEDYMDAIDGDESPWSYMCASILARQLAEFGAMWHGCNWGTHIVLDENPCTAVGQSEEGDADEGPMTPAAEWKWSQPAPTEWAPQVQREADAVRVTFFTYSALGEEAIYRHIDTFKPGAYRFESDRQQIATGRGGFVF